MWRRRTKLPVLVAWMVVLGVVGYIATHPSTLAPLASRLLSRHLLQDVDGQLRLRDFDLRPLGGVDLYDVSLSLRGDGGSMTLVAVDTLVLDFRWRELLRPDRRVRAVRADGVEVYAIAGAADPARAFRPPDFAALPRTRIDLIAVENLSLELSGPDGRLRERISAADWRGEIVLDDSLAVRTRRANVIWDSRRSTLEQIYGRIVADGAGVRADELNADLNGAPIVVSGWRVWNGDFDLTVAGQGASTAEVENLLATGLTVVAQGDIEARIQGQGETIRLDGMFSGDLEGYHLQEMQAVVVVEPQEVRVTSAQGRVNGAWFAGEGTFDTSVPERLAFVLEGQVADVDLQSGLVPGDSGLPATDGQGWVRIAYSDSAAVTNVRGGFRAGRIAPLPFDTCFVDVTAHANGIDFHRIALDYGDLHAVLRGHADTTDVFTGSLVVRADDLTDAPAAWDWPAVRGAVRAEGQLTGPPDALAFRGWVSGRGLALGEFDVAASEVALAVDDVLGEPVFTLGADGTGLAVGGVPLGDYVLWGSLSARGARVDSFRTVRGDTTITLRGRADLAAPRQIFDLEDFGIDLEGAQWQLARPARIELEAGALAIPGVEMISERGSLLVQGLYEPDAVVAGSVDLRRFDLGLLNPLLGTSDHLSGEATAEVVVAGTPARPVAELSALVTGADFPALQVDSLRVAASYNTGALLIDALSATTSRGLVTLSGKIEHPGATPRDFWPGAALDLDITVADGDWSYLDTFGIAALDRLSGRFAARLHAGGTTDDPLVVGDVTSAPFHIHWAHLDSLRGAVVVDRDALAFSRLSGRKGELPLEGQLELPLEFDLTAAPRVREEGPFHARIVIPDGTDLAPLAAATNAFLESSGRGGLELTVAGPLAHPTYSGRFACRDVGFVLRRLGEIYRNCSARGVFSGDELVIEDIRGEEGLRGSFTGRGRVLFRGLELETFDLDLAVDRFLVASIPELRVLVRSPAVRLEGVRVGPDSLLAPKFTGELEVVKARYTGDFSERGRAGGLGEATVAPDWLADLHLHGAARNTRIQNRAMELDLSGDVTLVRDLTGVDLRGGLTIDAGRLPVFNNTFDVERGTLDFSRDIGIVPEIDLDASTRVRLRSKYSNTSVLERVTVHVRGSIDEPEITYSSESGYSRAGIERMLLGLSPQAAEDDAQRLRSTSIAAGLNLVEREIAQELDIFDTFEIDQIDRTTESGSGGFEPLFGYGKYLGQDFYVKVAHGFNLRDSELLIEYQISDHVLLQSEIRRRLDEFQGEDTYNLDLKYRLEY